MSVATIAKRFTFHAAHRLPNHDGQCRDLHGHSYVLEVLVTGPVKRPQAKPEPDEGMVFDFGAIKDIYKRDIEPLVEHKFLNETLAGKVPVCSIDGGLADEPLTTCENVASWMRVVFTRGIADLDRRPSSAMPPYEVAIRLWETPTSYAEVGPLPARRGY